MLTVIVFFLVLSILILIHEAGHFFVAKRSGMLVEEFGFGLPPRIFGIKRGETTYSINLLPFGGFVKIFGESPEDFKKNPGEKNLRRSFNHKPWYLRAAVIVAGPIMNFLLAVLVISYMFTKGTYLPSGEVKILKVEKNSPASAARLQKNDILVSFAGKNLSKNTDLVDLSQKYAGQRVKILLKRGESQKLTFIIARKNPPQGQGALGIHISDTILKKYPWYQAPFIGLRESVKISLTFYTEMGKLLGKVITFQKPQIEVTGPIGIAKLTGEAVSYGTGAVIQLLGLLSLNLALINIVPFPALDGGQLAFVLYEAITRRKLNEELKAKINALGFAFLLMLLGLITFKDVTGLLAP